jgi:hypothetical protein
MRLASRLNSCCFGSVAAGAGAGAETPCARTTVVNMTNAINGTTLVKRD